jgi:hypothetical protein
MTGKQRRTVFPDQAAWRAERGLELVHGDLCGPISPATPSGNSYFLLLVDDHSRYMWISTLVSKNQAAATIMDFQSRAEGESGHKLSMLCTQIEEASSPRSNSQSTVCRKGSNDS